MQLAIAFALGVVFGMLAFWFLARGLKDSVRATTADALSNSARQLADSAGETVARHTAEGRQALDAKKELIDQSLRAMNEQLQRVTTLMGDLEKNREYTMGQVSTQLAAAAEQTGRLQQTTEQLRSALANPKVRGQWGERMADDILRLLGFIEGINYRKQASAEGSTSRPDFTFLLPQGLKVNMDVKFPLSSYLYYLNTESDVEREHHRTQFLRDVRARLKEVTVKDYINPQDGTVDYVILFIPNERVYSFVNECDPGLMDDALRAKVVVCSPFTLYAVLAVIRQAADNFRVQGTATEMLALLGGFNKQWTAFVQSFDRVGKRIEDLQSEFAAMTTTRRNVLERQLRKIEDLREQRGIAAEIDGEPPPALADPTR